MKIFKYCFVLPALLLSVGIFAQGFRPLASRIQEAKNTNLTFKDVNNLLSVNRNFGNSLTFSNKVSNANYFDFNPVVAGELIKNASELLILQLPSFSRGKEWILELEQVPASFYDYEVVTSSGESYFGDPSDGLHYRGVVKGREENSLVALSIFKDEVMGIISIEGEGNYNLSKVKKSSVHALYNDFNLKAPQFKCDTQDDLGNYSQDVLFNSSVERLASKCVRIYLETEYDIYQNKGSVSAVVSYVSGLFNQVATLYKNESINTVLSQIKVWNTTDPYNATNTASLLNEFQTQTSAINGDLGQLLTFRSVGGGRAAGFSGICNSNVDQKLSVSGIYDTYLDVPTYSWSVMVVTHEFGHLFGSRHTHACVWNGNNTAIDGCSGATEGTCPLPGIPSGGGTIMSYCHLQSVGINFNLGFGSQPGNVIRSSVAGGTCIGSCAACPANLLVTTSVGAGVLDNRQANNTLTASNLIFNNGSGIYKAGVNVKLVPGFHAYPGAYFRGFIAGCTSFTVTENETVGLETSRTSLPNGDGTNWEFKIFPNPSNGRITISHPFESSQKYEVHLYDFKGNLILNEKMNGENNQLELSELGNGIYLVKIISGSRYFAQKLVLNQ